jgi:hypothetical protein
MLLFFVLIYVGIVAALFARLAKRGREIFTGEDDNEAQQIPLRG